MQYKCLSKNIAQCIQIKFGMNKPSCISVMHSYISCVYKYVKTYMLLLQSERYLNINYSNKNAMIP